MSFFSVEANAPITSMLQSECSNQQLQELLNIDDDSCNLDLNDIHFDLQQEDFINSEFFKLPVKLIEKLETTAASVSQKPKAISRVDLLNSIIQNIQSSKTNMTISSSPSCLSSSSATPVNNPLNQPNDDFIQPQLFAESLIKGLKKEKKENRDEEDNYSTDDRERICVVCGTEGKKGIGFHYGATTCEACKLFFRRMNDVRKKNLVKIVQCKTKNCKISPNSRSCAECRYKKCISVGMSLDRSRFGRQLQETYINYTAGNIATDLCKLLHGHISLFYEKPPQYHQQIEFLNQTIVDFYDQSLSLISTSSPIFDSYSISTSSTSGSSSREIASNIKDGYTPLSQLSSIMFNSTKPSTLKIEEKVQTTKLPDFFVALCIVLFKINIEATSIDLTVIINDLTNHLECLEEETLKLPDTIKMLIFLKTVWLYFAYSSSSKKVDLINHPFNKHIVNLMRAEFKMVECREDKASSSNLEIHSAMILNEPNALFRMLDIYV